MNECGWKQLTVFAVSILLIPGKIVQGQESSSLTPVELVRRTVQNEEKARQDPARFEFRDRKQTLHGTTTKLMLETKDTMVDIVIANDDKPVGLDERKRAVAALEMLAGNPDEVRKKTKKETQDDEQFGRILQALPDAFLFEADGEVSSTSGVGHAGDRLLRLKFQPNPNYKAPSSMEKVLAGLQGEILIDPARMRIAKMEGRLFKDVGLVWSVLAHLDAGGRFLLQQAPVDATHWGITRMTLDFKGKVVFRHFEIASDEIFSDYCPVPENLTFAEGVKRLSADVINGPR